MLNGILVQTQKENKNAKHRYHIVIHAFEDAVTLRRPEEGLVFHSDRGIQYICDRFQDCLKSYQALSSMSRKGNCLDNAVAESFFHTLKLVKEFLSLHNP